MAVESVDLLKVVDHGIGLCRKGDWKKGLRYLVPAMAEASESGTELPGRAYSYAGYGIAYYESKFREGLDLCRHAVETEFYEPENYLFLAKTYALRNSRRQAFEAIEKGLEVDGDNQGLIALWNTLDRRRPPVLRFLPRNHPVNRFLGRVRHRLTPRRELQEDNELDLASSRAF